MDDQQRHFLDVIAGAAVQMGRLIDDILAFSRMGRADLMRMRVSMDQLVREARESLQAELQGRAVTWRSGPLPDVQGDAAMLKTVLVNLLANAIKFTRGQPDAVIEIGHQPAADGSPVFFVKDNGAGFDMRYADKLFGLFQRLHRVDEFEGTGVGLASVRRIIQRHGGQAWAEGAAGRGATFYFSLPARPGA
jgi:light-regulated signal transduction histidine kinase (bacteriophytochrome)